MGKRLFQALVWTAVALAAVVPTLAFTDPPVARPTVVESMERLEAIAVEAGSLEHFLSDTKIQNRYFTELELLFGAERFKRTSFEAILGQMRKLVQDVPEAAARLWKPIAEAKAGKAYRVELAIKTYGRELDVELWKTDIEALTNGTARESLSGATDIKALRERVDEKMKLAEAEVQSRAAGVKKAEAGRIRSEVFAALQADPEVKQLGVTYLNEVLRSERIQDSFRSNDPDLILNTLNDLRNNPRAFIPDGEKVPGPVVNGFKDRMPGISEFLNKTDVFPVRMIQTKRGRVIPAGSGVQAAYDFLPVERRLHSVWVGAPLGECVGGCSNNLSSLTPERWATNLIEDAQMHFVARNEAYAGFVEETPGLVGSEKMATITLGVPDMSKRVLVQDSRTGNKVGSTLFSEWHREAYKHKPSEWKGYVISRTSAVDNANAFSAAWASSEFKLGTEVTANGPWFTLQDPIASKIVAHSPKSDLASNYAGSMIFDATVPQAKRSGELTLLVPVADRDLRDPVFLANHFRTAAPSLKLRTLLFLQTSGHKPHANFNDDFVDLVFEGVPDSEYPALTKSAEEHFKKLAGSPAGALLKDRILERARKLPHGEVPAAVFAALSGLDPTLGGEAYLLLSAGFFRELRQLGRAGRVSGFVARHARPENALGDLLMSGQKAYPGVYPLKKLLEPESRNGSVAMQVFDYLKDRAQLMNADWAEYLLLSTHWEGLGKRRTEVLAFAEVLIANAAPELRAAGYLLKVGLTEATRSPMLWEDTQPVAAVRRLLKQIEEQLKGVPPLTRDQVMAFARAMDRTDERVKRGFLSNYSFPEAFRELLLDKDPAVRELMVKLKTSLYANGISLGVSRDNAPFEEFSRLLAEERYDVLFERIAKADAAAMKFHLNRGGPPRDFDSVLRETIADLVEHARFKEPGFHQAVIALLEHKDIIRREIGKELMLRLQISKNIRFQEELWLEISRRTPDHELSRQILDALMWGDQAVSPALLERIRELRHSRWPDDVAWASVRAKQYKLDLSRTALGRVYYLCGSQLRDKLEALRKALREARKPAGK